MEGVKFLVGGEKRFGDFISSMDEEDKIVLISHTDVDGISSAKIANEVLDADVLKFVDYSDLNNSLVKELKEIGATKVIFTDLNFTGQSEQIIKEIEKFTDILIIDHHRFDKDLNSEKTVFLNGQGVCAAYLCYYLFGKVKNLEKLDWLVACAFLADWAWEGNGDWLKKVYEKYSEIFIEDENGIKKSKIWDLQWSIGLALIYFDRIGIKKVYDFIGDGFGDIGDLEKYSGEVKKEIDNSIDKFFEKKEEIGGRYFWEFNPRFGVTSFVCTLVSAKNKHKTLIIGHEGNGKYFLNARRQDKGEDVSILMKKFIEGFEDSNAGGHIPAAGAVFPIKYKEEFLRRLREL